MLIILHKVFGTSWDVACNTSPNISVKSIWAGWERDVGLRFCICLDQANILFPFRRSFLSLLRWRWILKEKAFFPFQFPLRRRSLSSSRLLNSSCVRRSFLSSNCLCLFLSINFVCLFFLNFFLLQKKERERKGKEKKGSEENERKRKRKGREMTRKKKGKEKERKGKGKDKSKGARKERQKENTRNKHLSSSFLSLFLEPHVGCRSHSGGTTLENRKWTASQEKTSL